MIEGQSASENSRMLPEDKDMMQIAGYGLLTAIGFKLGAAAAFATPYLEPLCPSLVHLDEKVGASYRLINFATQSIVTKTLWGGYFNTKAPEEYKAGIGNVLNDIWETKWSDLSRDAFIFGANTLISWGVGKGVDALMRHDPTFGENDVVDANASLGRNMSLIYADMARYVIQLLYLTASRFLAKKYVTSAIQENVASLLSSQADKIKDMVEYYLQDPQAAKQQMVELEKLLELLATLNVQKQEIIAKTPHSKDDEGEANKINTEAHDVIEQIEMITKKLSEHDIELPTTPKWDDCKIEATDRRRSMTYQMQRTLAQKKAPPPIPKAKKKPNAKRQRRRR